MTKLLIALDDIVYRNVSVEFDLEIHCVTGFCYACLGKTNMHHILGEDEEHADTFNI